MQIRLKKKKKKVEITAKRESSKRHEKHAERSLFAYNKNVISANAHVESNQLKFICAVELLRKREFAQNWEKNCFSIINIC